MTKENVCVVTGIVLEAVHEYNTGQNAEMVINLLNPATEITVNLAMAFDQETQMRPELPAVNARIRAIGTDCEPMRLLGESPMADEYLMDLERWEHDEGSPFTVWIAGDPPDYERVKRTLDLAGADRMVHGDNFMYLRYVRERGIPAVVFPGAPKWLEQVANAEGIPVTRGI